MNTNLITNIMFALGALSVVIGAFLKVMHYFPGKTSGIFMLAGHAIGLIAFVLLIWDKKKSDSTPKIIN